MNILAVWVCKWFGTKILWCFCFSWFFILLMSEQAKPGNCEHEVSPSGFIEYKVDVIFGEIQHGGFWVRSIIW